MNRKEVIKILESDVEEYKRHGGRGIVDEAIRFVPSRPRWTGAGGDAHPVIKRRPYRSEKFKECKLSEDGEVLYRRTITIHEDWTDDYCSVCGKKLCSRFQNFCPNCGRALTEAAWAELERRIHGGTTDN